jgi:hypothetical protein
MRVAMAERRDGDAAGEIEEFTAGGIEEVGALAPLESQVGPSVCRHQGRMNHLCVLPKRDDQKTGRWVVIHPNIFGIATMIYRRRVDSGAPEALIRCQKPSNPVMPRPAIARDNEAADALVEESGDTKQTLRAGQ